MVQIAPSILSADFSKLGEEIRALESAGADFIHIDVMDGHFVPNITMGSSIIKSLRPHTKLPFDVHLMIENADCYIESFAEAGANILTVHPESEPHIHRTLQHIRKLGCKAGLALNPGTPIQHVENLLDAVDLILVMTVNPGFGGQSFITSQLEKIRQVRQLIDQSGYSIHLEVDGGITAETAPDAVAAGADILVAGTAVFRSEDYAGNIALIRNNLG